jgi:death-on-curing protein
MESLPRRNVVSRSFGGWKAVYADVAEIAAAYLFYLCRNQAFIDGNKRAALGACIVFLRLNGIEPGPDAPKWEREGPG